MLKRICRLFILILLTTSGLSAQDNYIRYKRITINDGLSLSSVYNIYQDSKGFMWFGTEDGLNKYDGQVITVFGATTDRHSILANKWIELVYEDKSGMIWLGSRSGLTKYNPRRGTFQVIKNNPEDSFSLSNDSITSITTDLNNDLWVGTFAGLNRIDRITGEAMRIIPEEPDLKGLMSHISGFILDPSGNLWIGTHEGLFSHDRKSGLFFNETLEGKISRTATINAMALGEEALWLGTDSALIMMDLSDQETHRIVSLANGHDPAVQSLLVDGDNQVWIQSQTGLYCLGSNSSVPVEVLEKSGTTHSLALHPGEPMIMDMKGDVWYGSYGEGAYRINPATLDYVRYTHNPADPSSLSDNSINCIFEDRSGGLWFGTFGAGISIINPKANQFPLYKHNPFDTNSLASSFIWNVNETADSVLWIGSDAHGISCYDKKTGIFTHHDHNPGNPRSLSHSSVRIIYQDRQENIWAGTDGGGLNLYQAGEGTFRHYLNDPLDSTSISNNSVRAIYEDRHGRLWVGTRNGLNLLDRQKGTFRRFLVEAGRSPQPHSFIYSAIFLDEDEQLWLGTYGGGLCRLDPESGTYELFSHDPEDPNSISDNIVFSIHRDQMGRFWIGTNSGLNMFYPASGSFRRFGLEEGLANEVIYGILADDQNRIWLSTNLGIARFNLETFEVKNFDMNDGLQSNEFNGGAYHKGRDGKLYFGGVYGLSIIDPDHVSPVRNVSDVTLTSLEVLGKEVGVAGIEVEELFEGQPGKIIEYEGEYYTSEHITYLEEIKLDYMHRFFSVEFAALNNLQPGKLQYSYIMEGLEDEWNRAGNRNYVSYANMKAGTYTLKVIAENEDGVKSDRPLSLDIIVTPPFWLSWWFISLEILVAFALAVMIYIYLVKSRTNRLLKDQNLKISEANHALRESEKNLMELNATKDKFFSIVSHDLKNPFSSLLSISELMVENFDNTEREDHQAGFRKINQSIRHLLDLLENLLTWSRSQRGKISYDPVRFNLSALIQENINVHRLLAERKGILLLSPVENEVFAYGDRNMINSVIRNLVTNALKFTDRNKTVQIKVENGSEKIKVSIIDEGIGIGSEQIDKLFRIDEKFKTTGTAGEKGTGLGLIICKEFVEINGGSIDVESKPGKGSNFSFTIPCSN